MNFVWLSVPAVYFGCWVRS